MDEPDIEKADWTVNQTENNMTVSTCVICEYDNVEFPKKIT